MDERFKEKYGVYDGIKVDTFKHIPEISFYNHNYYIGLNGVLMQGATGMSARMIIPDPPSPFPRSG